MQKQKSHGMGTGFIFIITYLAYTSIYISRLNLSIATTELTASGIMNEAEIGLLGSIFSVVFAIGRLLNGVLNDKLTPWIMLCTGLAAVGLSNIVSGIFMSFAVMAVLWGINAYAQSMLWGSVLRAMSSVYDPDKASKRTAIMVSSVAVGNLLGILVNTWIISITGKIEMAFIIPGALNLIMCPLTFIALKKIPFEPIGKRVNETVKELILTGATAEKIKSAVEAAGSETNITVTETFEQAVKTAAEKAQKGDTVILSPMCASFDRFKNFEERGNRFKELVAELEM